MTTPSDPEVRSYQYVLIVLSRYRGQQAYTEHSGVCDVWAGTTRNEVYVHQLKTAKEKLGSEHTDHVPIEWSLEPNELW